MVVRCKGHRHFLTLRWFFTTYDLQYTTTTGARHRHPAHTTTHRILLRVFVMSACRHPSRTGDVSPSNPSVEIILAVPVWLVNGTYYRALYEALPFPGAAETASREMLGGLRGSLAMPEGLQQAQVIAAAVNDRLARENGSMVTYGGVVNSRRPIWHATSRGVGKTWIPLKVTGPEFHGPNDLG